MTSRFFTSDWHLGDERIGINGNPDLFFRFCSTLDEMHERIYRYIKESLRNGDTLYHLGDVCVDEPKAKIMLSKIRDYLSSSKMVLILGNYDENKIDFLSNYFDDILLDKEVEIGQWSVFMDHYPHSCKEMVYTNGHDFGITGHIHGLWKVKHKLLNVGVDAWHFRPVHESQIEFIFNAMEKYYDHNVFI